jgi:membrane peptidoglycan carboxypeptidase
VNEIFFGNQSYGVESAGEFYFNTPARNLNRAQSALLAGLIEAPASFDPIINRAGAFERMNAVLSRQAEVGCIQFDFDPYRAEPFCITAAELQTGQVILEKAQVEAANYRPRENQNRYPHFVNYVQAQVEQYYGTSEMFRRGFQIYTTLNPRIQDTAQAALVAGVANGASAGINNGAVLVAEPGTGAIRAMVGSPDFNNRQIDGEVNNVFTWHPPGEAIQPIIYTAALEGQTNPTSGAFEYMTPSTVLWNVPTTFNTNPPFAPQNFGSQYTGPTSIRFSLGNGYAVNSAKAYQFIGDQHFIDTSSRMGVNYLQDAVFGLPASQGINSVRLYDMVEAYGTLAANGQRAGLTAISRVTDNQGNEIATPERAPASQQVQPQVAFLINSILSDDVARSATYGFGSALNLQAYAGRVAVKTGTSTGNQDLWAIGYSSNLVVGVWTGSYNNTNTSANTMGVSVPVWNAVMNAALQGTNPAFQQPAGIVQAQVCSLTGALYDPNVTQNCSAVRTELFLQSAPPLSADQGFVQSLNVDSWSGLLANQYCPDNVIAGRFLNVTDPSAVNWLSSPAGQAFAAQNGLTGLTGLTPPSACTISSQNPVLALTGPTNGQTVQGTIQFTGTVQAFNFSQYTIEIAPQNAPTAFTVVVGPNNTQVQNGALGTFDTTRVPNGVYTFRLAVYNTSNGYAYRTAQVNINNPPPTPTPTSPPVVIPTQPIIIATPLPIIVATPLPFDPFSSTGPTPTINFGG